MNFMKLNYFTYKTDDIRCKHCGWSGKGKELKYGEFHESSFIADMECPNCHETIGFWQAPLTEEVEQWRKGHPGWKDGD